MKLEIRLRAETGFDPDSLPHLKNLFIGTHRGPTWLSFLQLSPFELKEARNQRWFVNNTKQPIQLRS
ncbi:hypothetical protein P5673_009233 [Acropora cervicornis]|uniref:Uncharacterized protein n=1 Tax=Acropora cervicornis TaxID=6130 RepID=A0AAD9V9W2_ACRCE|nr:hypothetical protein P5673_009233 [Acropora cervicornis]